MVGQVHIDVETGVTEFASASARQLYEDTRNGEAGPLRPDIVNPDPHRSPLFWLRRFQLKGHDPKDSRVRRWAQAAVQVWEHFHGTPKLEEMILEPQTCRTLFDLTCQIDGTEPQDQDWVSLDLDGQPIPLKDGEVDTTYPTTLPAWGYVAMPEDTFRCPEQVPEVVQGWWNRLLAVLAPSPDSEGAHRAFRREIRKVRRVRALLELLDAIRTVRRGFEPHLSARARRVLKIRRITRDQKVTFWSRGRNGDGTWATMSLDTFVKTRRWPKWFRSLLNSENPALEARLWDRTLAKEEVLAEVVLPTRPRRGCLESRNGSGQLNPLSGYRARRRRMDDQEAMRLAHYHLMNGDFAEALRWVAWATHRKVAKDFKWQFLPPSAAEYGIELRPREGLSQEERVKELNRLFHKLLALNWESPEIRVADRLWLWKSWWPAVKMYYLDN